MNATNSTGNRGDPLAPRQQINADSQVIDDFGKEWQAFHHRDLSDTDLTVAFNEYFHVFPMELLGKSSRGFDMGCGSGRWARLMAPRVGGLTCIDASAQAIAQAEVQLAGFDNCSFECASVSGTGLTDASQDFGYCLGVLHHIPDTQEGLNNCASKLKPGAPFLLYLYYRFDNKPAWFRLTWRVSDVARRIISRLPFSLKLLVSQLIATFFYWPFSKLALLLEKLGVHVENLPLSVYRNKPFYFLRTDALDRFGTRLEKRFTRKEIEKMMIRAGFERIRFSTKAPYWVAVGFKT